MLASGGDHYPEAADGRRPPLYGGGRLLDRKMQGP